MRFVYYVSMVTVGAIFGGNPWLAGSAYFIGLVWERGWSFIKKAGTIILLSTIVIWFLSFFGWEN